jgi:perosamine synthetase
MTVRADYLAFGKPDFGEDEIAAVTRTLRSGWVGMGVETLKFEEELAATLRVPHVVTVNSCSSALFLSLLAHGVGAGDEVICPSLTWCATANAALYLGARPVFCDIDPKTFCVTPETVAAKVTSRTKAVMVVHYGGLPADVSGIRAVLPKGVAIIEDAAHALGAEFPDGFAVGSSGNLTCFSFYANKNLSTGEGGAIALSDDRIAERLRSLRQSGLSADAWKRYIQPLTTLAPGIGELGYKMNFTDLQSSIGRVQLKRQPEFKARRLSIAKLYCARLKAGDGMLTIQRGILDPGHARHLFVVRLPLKRLRCSRDEFILALRNFNIGASIHYAPLHRMPLYAEFRSELPVTDIVCSEILTLPISATMGEADADYVVLHTNELLRERG